MKPLSIECPNLTCIINQSWPGCLNVDKHEFAQNYVTCDKNELYQQHRYTMNKPAVDIV